MTASADEATVAVSGGKVWSIPVEEDSKLIIRESRWRAFFLTIGACFTVGLGMFLSTKFSHGSAYIDEASSVPGALPEIITTGADGWLIPLFLATFFVSVSMVVDIFGGNSSAYKGVWVVVVQAVYGILLFLYTASMVHIAMFPGAQDARNLEIAWVKEHHHVELKDRVYGINTEAKGIKEDGSEAVLKVFRFDDETYLYETKDELKALFEKLP